MFLTVCLASGIIQKEYSNGLNLFKKVSKNLKPDIRLTLFLVNKFYIIVCKFVIIVKLIIKFTPHIIINTDNIFFRLTSSLNMK